MLASSFLVKIEMEHSSIQVYRNFWAEVPRIVTNAGKAEAL
jgi:hypothetical protein